MVLTDIYCSFYQLKSLGTETFSMVRFTKDTQYSKLGTPLRDFIHDNKTIKMFSLWFHVSFIY